MYIFLSPSKTKNTNEEIYNLYLKNIAEANLVYEENEEKLKAEKEIFEEDQKIKNVIEKEDSKEKNEISIFRYSGFVFKKLELESYYKEEFEYIFNHVKILSAKYGILNGLEKIDNYRLDYSDDKSLYKYWEESIDKYFSEFFAKKDVETIDNLTSQEYFKSIEKAIKKYVNKDQKIYNINFYTTYDSNKGIGKKLPSSLIKKARGIFLNFMIKNKIENISNIIFSQSQKPFTLELEKSSYLELKKENILNSNKNVSNKNVVDLNFVLIKNN